jgi:intracellular septation protein A
MYNASDQSYVSTIIGFVVNMTIFCGFAYFMVRGLTSRKGLFSSFRSILVGVFLLGILLLVQSVLDSSILQEMADAGLDTSEVGISFVNLGYLIYFLGIAVTGFVFFRNRRDTKQWFPAKA